MKDLIEALTIFGKYEDQNRVLSRQCSFDIY
jgi:hypothetical protein